MIDINKCAALLDPEFEDPDGCSNCHWETWQCRDAALARLAQLRKAVEDVVAAHESAAANKFVVDYDANQ